jgi:Cu/Ag efflux protein CusF/cytochrome c553
MRLGTLFVLLIAVSLAGKGVEQLSNRVEIHADEGHDKKDSVSAGHAEEEEGHHHPENWQFRLPQGDIAAGRKAYDKFGCYSCHEIKGETFPKPEGQSVGAELSQMGPMHPLEFFAESIIHPNAEIGGKRYRSPDGTSKMPSFNEDMTVQELINLSSYISSLRPPGMAKTVTGEGKVIVTVPASQQIVVEHGDIKGFMEAMTMGYKVSPPSLLDGLKPGDRIRFTIDTDQKAIVEIKTLGR